MYPWGCAKAVQNCTTKGAHTTCAIPRMGRMHVRVITTFCCFLAASLVKKSSFSAQIYLEISLQIQFLSFTNSHSE